jgi:hypothetical protein
MSEFPSWILDLNLWPFNQWFRVIEIPPAGYTSRPIKPNFLAIIPFSCLGVYYGKIVKNLTNTPICNL